MNTRVPCLLSTLTQMLQEYWIETLGGQRVKDLFNTMIILNTNLNVLPEKQKEVLQTLLAMIAQTEKDKGCLSHGIFCNIEDKNAFNLFSEWDTREHLDHYIRSQDFSVLLGTKSLLREPLKIKIFSILDSEGIEAVISARKQRN